MTPGGSSAAPETPSDSPLTLEDVLASPVYRDLTTAKLRPGEPAFDFELRSPQIPRSHSRRSIRDTAAAGMR